ncbi:alpha-mannosidase [Halanaerobium saccharolyticum]|uniref:Alpha-mannosidase n=1 Tax=Halanaerobium saccharolyticum TaxID=43595 RepID=A0A4R7Z6K6_9FIRM|nr:alpha-mannosidase [Halanaerobium saccharolyticum]RAK12517.1 alpha-mannosidase [Halanaerobium saccharolyticum]TDW06443.1 alpha-mannosidase [Halanaerobium saccharolyticum]TDX61691.1 alpha-mannosidase [Halanaerobium saccharolyticum]
MFMKEGKIERYLKDLKENLVQASSLIEKFEVYPAELNNKTLPDFSKMEAEILQVGERWGGENVCRWFNAEISVPEEWDLKKGKVYLEIIPGEGHYGNLSGSESLLYLNGMPLQGLDRSHSLVFLNEKELSSSPELNISLKSFSGLEAKKHIFKKAALIYRDKNLEDFYQRAKVVFESLKTMEEGEDLRKKLLRTLDASINILDFRKVNSEEFLLSAEKANIYLKKELEKLNASTKDNLPAITAVGHSHIDVAWLWQLLHTREKCSRTFSTVLKLMDEYPEYTFVQTMPQLYKFIKEDYPDIYAKIKEKIKEGKWEITGGMWVEADCNVTSGESLVRQFIHGKKFIKEEFDVEWNILWLPDVFGYSWALPQIIKKSGMKYFMTTKISWSQFNRPEYDTFTWRGIDGTEVLTHFITTPEIHNDSPFYTYNGILNPESAKGIWDNYQQKDINDDLLLAYGWGDGGGGPTRKMIESGKKMQEVPGMPKVNFGKSEDYFKNLAQKMDAEKELPVWDGELYLEYHRGTYTSQAEVKKNNRKAEIRLHDLELFNNFSSINSQLEYPAERINQNWEVVLKNQFHDILPGSSIKEVYEDSSAEFKELFQETETLLNRSLEEIAIQIEGTAEKVVVYNSLPWSRDGYLQLNDKEYEIKDIPASGYYAVEIDENTLEPVITDDKRIKKSSAKTAVSELKVGANSIENQFYKIELNNKGQIVSIYDKEFEREIITENGTANLLQAFEDRPMRFNAWDIDIYYQDKEYVIDDLKEMEINKVNDKVIINLEWRFLDSTIKQDLIIYADKRRIDFETEVDWQEEQILLKTAFPVDLRTTKANYEIQFGNVERNTHWNTSWDYAKFEVVGHKWADLSEGDYGVSLLNDCKYGYDIKDQTMRLTLIKSGIYPDPEADQGHHSFTYSLYPHGGSWFEAETTKEAYELNYPVQQVKIKGEDGTEAKAKSYIEVEEQSTILETVKKAEYSDDLVLRFYEYGNRRDTVKVKLDNKIKSVAECNLVEENIEEVENNDSEFTFKIKPYEIKTFRVELE